MVPHEIAALRLVWQHKPVDDAVPPRQYARWQIYPTWSHRFV